MKKIILPLICLLFSTVALAQAGPSPVELTFQNGALKAEATWLEPGVVTGPETKMQIQWLNQAGQAVDLDGDFRVQLFMPDMGHGSSPTKIGKLAEPGLYTVNRIYFTMPGTWEVRVILRLTNQPAETQVLSVLAPPL
jgi:hypothetical protein